LARLITDLFSERRHGIAAPLVGLATSVLNLTELPGNPRRGDVDAIARSLRVFGQRKPITARQTSTDEHGQPVGYVTAGNHTLLAARDRLEWSHVAVVWIDEDETTANAWALADNRTGELGSTDADALALMLEGMIDDPDLFAATGYTDEDLAKLLDTGLMPPGDADMEGLPERWGVIVEVSSETEQVALLHKLGQEGYTVRAIL
jgi:hypothetical protein